MLAEIFEVIDNAVMLILPATIIGLFVWFIYRIKEKKRNVVASLKDLFCLVITCVIFVSILMTSMISIFQIATIFKESETVIEPWVKEASFVFIIFIWQVIGVALIFLLWRFIYLHQIIPGEGSIKERISYNIKRLKE